MFDTEYKTSQLDPASPVTQAPILPANAEQASPDAALGNDKPPVEPQSTILDSSILTYDPHELILKLLPGDKLCVTHPQTVSDAEIEADLKAGRLDALIQAARDEAEDAHDVNKPIDNKMFIGRASNTEVLQLANQILQMAAQSMATRIFSRPGDMNDVARLTLTYQLLEKEYPGDWLLYPTENYGLCLVSANWDDA